MERAAYGYFSKQQHSWQLLALPLPGCGIRSIKSHLAKGSWAEATAIAWLLARGYVVAKNVSGWGFFDIVAVKQDGNHKPKEMHLIDVKYFNAENRSYNPLTKTQAWSGVRVLLVADDGHCEFVEKGKERIREKNKNDV